MEHIPNAYAEGAPATPSPPPDIYDEVAYAYDGSLEGLLSAVFAAYERRERPTDVAPEERLQPRLGQRDRQIGDRGGFSDATLSVYCNFDHFISSCPGEKSPRPVTTV